MTAPTPGEALAIKAIRCGLLDDHDPAVPEMITDLVRVGDKDAILDFTALAIGTAVGAMRVYSKIRGQNPLLYFDASIAGLFPPDQGEPE